MKRFGLLTCAILGLSIGLGAGCAERHQAQGYGEPPNTPADDATAGPPAPMNPAYGASPGSASPPPLQQSAPPAPPPPSASDVDHEVAGAIHRLLNNDEFLAPEAGNVTAKVYKGVVTLRGTVPSEHGRVEIVERISQMPGVDRVDDQLQLEGPR